jgi:ribosome-associated heat shock protein Hsp15
MRGRADCAGLVAQGSVRINRQPTAKPHAKLRVGDVLTIPARGTVLVLRVVSLAGRRGPAAEAQRLYLDLTPKDPNPTDASTANTSDLSTTSCISAESSAYRAP